MNISSLVQSFLEAPRRFRVALFAILLIPIFWTVFNHRALDWDLEGVVNLLLYGLVVAYARYQFFVVKPAPMITVIPKALSCTSRTRVNPENGGTEYEFKLALKILPLSSHPISVRRIETFVSPIKGGQRKISLGAYEKDRDWTNFDLYPTDQNGKNFERAVYLNLDDINFFLDAQLKPGDLTKTVDTTFGGVIDTVNPRMKNYFLNVKLEYHIIGQSGRVRRYGLAFKAIEFDKFSQIRSSVS